MVRVYRFFTALLLTCFVSLAMAQSYPTRPIRVIVPFPPGGALDGYVRIIQPALSQELGQPVVIENQPGAGGLIGASAVAKAAADGYTLLAGNIQTLALNAAVYPKMPYDALKDFAPIVQTVKVNYVLVVNPKVPVATVAELIAYAKANPGKLTYATSGAGSAQHLAVVLFAARTGTTLTHVPYKGVGALTQDLLGGVVDLAIADQASMMPHVKAGTLRAFALAGSKRSSDYPDIPTIAEAGNIAGYEAVAWQGFAGPANLPPPIVQRLNEAIRKVQSQPAIHQRLLSLAYTPVGDSPEEFARYIRDETAKWSKVAREHKISVD